MQRSGAALTVHLVYYQCPDCGARWEVVGERGLGQCCANCGRLSVWPVDEDVISESSNDDSVFDTDVQTGSGGGADVDFGPDGESSVEPG